MNVATQLPPMMTVPEFLDWATPDGSNRWELVDGIPRAMAPASDRHAAIQAEAARLIGNHLAERPGYSVMVATGVVIDDYNVRIPDIAVACQREGDIECHPQLLIEVLSPTDAADVSVYMEIATVDEVLVLDSTEVRAEVLRRPTWRREKIGSVVSLVSIGLMAPLAAFYRTVAEPPW